VLEGNLGICSPLVMELCRMNMPKMVTFGPGVVASAGHGLRCTRPGCWSTKRSYRRGPLQRVAEQHLPFFLVDSECNLAVGDFGLARLLPGKLADGGRQVVMGGRPAAAAVSGTWCRSWHARACG